MFDIYARKLNYSIPKLIDLKCVVYVITSKWIYMYHSFLIHSSADGHLGCFHVLAIIKQCCNEHWGTCVSFSSGFLGVYAQQWDCWVVWQFYFQFFKESPHCSPLVAPLVCIPTNSERVFPFLHTLSSIYCLQIFGSQPFWLVWSGTSLWFWFAFL